MRATKCFLLCAVIGVVMPSPALAQQVFEEFLNDGDANSSGYLGSVDKGVFVTEGWKTTELNSRIRFDLNAKGEFPEGLACGTVEVEFSNFDPITNFQGVCGLSDSGGECYVHTIGVYEDAHGNNHAAANKLETQLQIQATCDQCFDDRPGDLGGLDRRFKFKSVSSDWNEENNYFNSRLPSHKVQWQDHMQRHYIVSFTFSCGRIDYRLKYGENVFTDGYAWTWTNAPPGARPNMRYVFIGKDYSGGDKWIKEVIYHRVKVTSNTSCDCDSGTVCGDGVREGSEDCEGADLGDQTCASLGYTGGSLGCTSSCTFDVSGCIAAPEAGVDGDVGDDAGDAAEEAGSGGDTGDAGSGADVRDGDTSADTGVGGGGTGSDADAGDADLDADGGGGGADAGSGCNCQIKGGPGLAGAPFFAFALGGLLVARRRRER